MFLLNLLEVCFVIEIIKHEVQLCGIGKKIRNRGSFSEFDKSKTTAGIGASVMENENKPFKEVLGSLRRSNVNRIILAHLNINSIPNKFSLLAEGVSGNVDIIMISQTKVDETFPARQFYMMDTHLPIDWIEMAMGVV